MNYLEVELHESKSSLHQSRRKLFQIKEPSQCLKFQPYEKVSCFSYRIGITQSTLPLNTPCDWYHISFPHRTASGTTSQWASDLLLSAPVAVDIPPVCHRRMRLS